MYYDIPLYWIGNEFHTANPNDLGEGWQSEADLAQGLADEGYQPVKMRSLPGRLVDDYGYSDIRIYADRNHKNFCATGSR